MQAGFGTGVAVEPGGPISPPAFTPPSLAQMAKLFPQLEIVELLGRGGMGAVYKARQPALGRWVAVKVLPPQSTARAGFAERFNREARALARLSHANIVAVYEFGQAGNMPYFVMEYVEGVTLRRLVQERRLSAGEALRIVPQICEALQFAHEEGVVHRDIKPENVLLDKKGRVKIADFGIAKVVTGEQAEETITQDQVIGTPHYMAPEQVEHPETVDHRADIYSLGVVFYEMLTGELPLGKFQPPSKKVQVDVRLDEVVLHTLEKEPERRYQHVSQLKTDVETIAATPSAGSSGRESAPSGTARGPALADASRNAKEATIVFAGTVFFLFMLAVVAELSRATVPFRGFLIVICVVGLVICALSLAGHWPFPSPWFPEPNFSSRNRRRWTAGENRQGISGWLRRSLIPEDTATRWAQGLSFGAALVILVLGFLELPKFDLRPHELFFGILLVLILSLVLVVAGYLVGAVGRNRLRHAAAAQPPESAWPKRVGLAWMIAAVACGLALLAFVIARNVDTSSRLAREQNRQTSINGGAMTFGPVIESILKTMEVRPEGRVAELLDLDTGRRATSTSFGDNDRETHSWVRANQLDVIGVIEHGQIAVLCFDTVVLPAVTNGWETLTTEAVVTNWHLAQNEPNKITGISPMTDKTDTWLFRTREGGRGILQILGQSHDPLGVRVRYKLVQTPPPKP
jgi:serine/threonine protein kinase